MALAGEVSRTGLVLGIERIEVLLKSLFARLAGVNGAAGLPQVDPVLVRPQNRGPDQAVPAIRVATAESDR